MTYSIAGKCEKTGAIGAAITTSSIAVTSRCVWVRSHTGVVLSQNITDPRLGQLGLTLLNQGFGANAVLNHMRDARPHTEWRQLAVLDTDGNTAWFSGKQALGIHAGATGKNCVAVGNLLANDGIPQAMINAFEETAGQTLAQRLLTSLKAGLDAGGETDDEHSAGVIVYGSETWPIVDLRVDWDNDPVQRLTEIWQRYEPQLPAYLLRAKNPQEAPDF